MDLATQAANAGMAGINVITTLMYLLGYASLLYAILHIIFDLPLYNVLFGRGTKQADGTYDWQSKFFPTCDPRPYVAMVVGVMSNYHFFHFLAFTGILSLDVSKMEPGAIDFDQIATGIGVSMGCKIVIYFADEYKKGRAKIKELQDLEK